MSGFEFDQKVSEQLNRLFGTQALRSLRQRYFELFDVKAGERVLDIGCGTGANAVALVDFLQGQCEIVGIDNSPPMLAIGNENLKTFPYSGRVSLIADDIHTTKIESGSFDSAMIIQVLEYSKEPATLLEQAKRVVKRGGKVFVADTDWDTIVWNSNQKEKTRRVVNLWSDHEADGWQGRKILELMKRAGFVDLRGGCFVIEDTRYQDSHYSFIVTQLITDYLIRTGKMPANEVHEWLQDLEEKERDGHFYFSVNRYAFTGIVP